MSKKVILGMFVLASLVGTVEVSAQTLGRVESTNSTAPDYYFFVQPGERTIQVYLIGALGNPGLYEVGSETTLGQVLAIAGGPSMTTLQARNKRKTEIRVIRSSGEAYFANLDDSLTPYVDFPGLREGDIVRVDVIESTKFGWRDGLQIVTAAASLALIYDRIQN